MWQVPMISLPVCKYGVERGSYEKTRRWLYCPHSIGACTAVSE